MKPVQKFTPEYLELCRKMTPDQIAQFLEDFRLLYAGKETPVAKVKTKLISMKVEENLLGAFKTRCSLLGIPYQTQIKKIMRVWLEGKH